MRALSAMAAEQKHNLLASEPKPSEGSSGSGTKTYTTTTVASANRGRPSKREAKAIRSPVRMQPLDPTPSPGPCQKCGHPKHSTRECQDRARHPGPALVGKARIDFLKRKHLPITYGEPDKPFFPSADPLSPNYCAPPTPQDPWSASSSPDSKSRTSGRMTDRSSPRGRTPSAERADRTINSDGMGDRSARSASQTLLIAVPHVALFKAHLLGGAIAE